MICALQKYHILPNNLCDSLIDLFDNDVQHHDRVDSHGLPNFTQLNLNRYHDKIIPSLCSYFFDIVKLYIKDVPSARFLPQLECLEEFRIKKYEVGGVDRFDEHVDVTDYASSIRCLSMLFYLNDVEEGGCTVFPYENIKIKPEKGNVCVFPPGWEYPHWGDPPTSNPKYIMSSYLHYNQ